MAGAGEHCASEQFPCSPAPRTFGRLVLVHLSGRHLVEESLRQAEDREATETIAGDATADATRLQCSCDLHRVARCGAHVRHLDRQTLQQRVRWGLLLINSVEEDQQ